MSKRLVSKLFLTICAGFSSLIWAQNNPATPVDWELTSVVLGHNLGERLKLKADHNLLSGSIYGWESVEIKGEIEGGEVTFNFKESDGTTNTYTAHLSGDTMAGNYVSTDPNEPKRRVSGQRVAPYLFPRLLGRLTSSPSNSSPSSGSTLEPVLHLFAGDTVHTTSVDAGGTDEHSVVRVLGGNPLTGPFYLEGAMPGDVVSITIKRLRLNRDWAMSDKGLVGRVLTTDYAAKIKPDWSDTGWHLDLEKGIASLEKPSAALKNLALTVRPMLGCIGVAPGFSRAAVSAQDSGNFGGNMDFNLLGEGATLYLSVNQPGALFYVGDGHALQGDGELNGNALETSMDIVFGVDVRREQKIGTPRAGNADFLMAIGLEGSLDSAIRSATSELAAWRQTDYKLSDSELRLCWGVRSSTASLRLRTATLASSSRFPSERSLFSSKAAPIRPRW
jgi:amidase